MIFFLKNTKKMSPIVGIVFCFFLIFFFQFRLQNYKKIQVPLLKLFQ